jgi:LL-diaminopimelate aminotransferase
MIRMSRRVGALPGYPLADLPLRKRALLARGVDVIDLGAGDNDTPPPAPVVEALKAALDDPALSKYGYQQGLSAFRQSIAGYMERRFGVSTDPVAEVVLLIGSKEGLAHLPLVVADPGEVCVVPEPGYQAYLGGTLLAEAVPFMAPLRADTGFLVDLDAVPEPVLSRTRLVFLNYPNNPTAAVAPPEYLARVVEVCRRRGIVLAYDNAYCDLTFDGYVAPSIFEIPGAREVAVEFFSLSKTFSMTGWRLGWATGRPELVAALTRVKTYTDTGPFLALQRAACVALDRAAEFGAIIRDRLVARRDRAVSALRRAGFEVTPPRAAMYLWVPLPPGVASAAFARQALEDEGVIIMPGSAFGPGGEGFFRVALTVEPARLEQAAERLGRALARSRAEHVAATA